MSSNQRQPDSAANVKNPITPRTRVGPPPPPPFWSTPKARNYVTVAGGLAAGAYFAGHTLLHTVFLNKYQSVVQLHKHGFPTKLNSEVLNRCHETVTEVGVSLKGPEMIKFFSAFGFDVFRAGSLKLRTGAIIGVPRHFNYKSEYDIEKQDIVVENHHVEWGSDGGELLKDSLILSERAQKFGIARELFMVDTHYPWIFGTIGTSSILGYGLISRFANEKFYGHMRPKSFRFSVYCLVGALAIGFYTTMTDLVTKYYENWVDKKVGNLNLEYAKGGIEFYSKILQRNMALRNLMGPNGEKTFTFYGNDVELIRQQHVPYTDRKKHLENIAEKLSSINNNNLKKFED